MNEVVRIDWVSTEDGGHILTVGVAANVYLYTQVWIVFCLQSGLKK